MPVKKKPSPAQLAARSKFVAMVRAKSKAKKSATNKISGTKKKTTKLPSLFDKPNSKQTGTSNKVKDEKRKALAPGKRKSATGKSYTERRANRSDKPGSLTGVNLAVRKIGSLQTDKIKKSIDWINFYNKELNFWKSFNPGMDKNYKKQKIDAIKFYRKSLIEEKKHFTELKKLL